MKAKTIKEVLVATRWIIDQVGWCQGRLYLAKDGKDVWGKADVVAKNLAACCLEGALYLVEIEGNETQVATMRWQTKLRMFEIGTNKQSLHIWNDYSAKTKQDVLNMLDKVIGSLPEQP